MNVDVLALHDKFGDGGINIAAAGAHGYAGQGGEAHGCIHAFAAVNGADGGAVAHVAGDQLQRFQGFSQHLGGTAGYITMAGAVKPVSAHLITRIVLVWDRVGEGLSGHGLMEGGVENANLGDIRPHDGGTGVDACNIGWVMERSQGDAVLQSLHHVGVDADASGKKLSAVNHPVADGVNFFHAGNYAVFGTDKFLDHSGYGLGMGGKVHVGFKYRFPICEGRMLNMSVKTYALAETFREDLLGFHIDQLVFEGRATGVNDQNLHF